MKKYVIPNKTKIGHVHLKVSDIKTSLNFYCDLLGFHITTHYGDSAVFLSSSDYHHHIALNTWYSYGSGPADDLGVGLYHFAILYPHRKDLALIYKRLIENKYPINGMSDHGVSEAIYIKDPDNNGIELYCDRLFNEWPKEADSSLAMYTKPLNLTSLLAEIDES